MLIVEDGSACSEEIDFVELRCATVPAYAGMTLVEKAYAGMILDQQPSATVIQKVAKLPSVNNCGVSHTANGEIGSLQSPSSATLRFTV